MEKLTVNNNSHDMKVSELIDMFIRSCQCSNLSDYTISYYKRCFKSFGKFFNLDSPCSSINLETIESYIFYLKEQGNINDITINTNLRGMRALLYFAMERGYLKRFKIKLIKAQKKVKETYTDEELDILLKKSDIKKCSFAEYRNWVIINYLLATGNRLETMSKIKIGDIDFVSQEIVLKNTKNSKQYIIPYYIR